MARETLDEFKGMTDGFPDEVETFGNFPGAYWGLVNSTGKLEPYDGLLRMVDAQGERLIDDVTPQHYRDYIAEAVEPWTYLKSPYFKPLGYPDGMYRVGPLARLNVADGCGTPHADREWAEFAGKRNDDPLTPVTGIRTKPLPPKPEPEPTT